MKSSTCTVFLCVAFFNLYVARAADADDFRGTQTMVQGSHVPSEYGEYAGRSSSDPAIPSLFWTMTRFFQAFIPAQQSISPHPSSSLGSSNEPAPTAVPTTAVGDSVVTKGDRDATESKEGDSREANTHVRQLPAPAPLDEWPLHVQPAVGAASAPSQAEHAFLPGRGAVAEETAPSPAVPARLHSDFFDFPWFNSPLQDLEDYLHLSKGPTPAPGPMANPALTSPEGQPAPSSFPHVPSSSPESSSKATFERRRKDVMKGSSSAVSSEAPALAASPFPSGTTIPSKARNAQHLSRELMPPQVAPESADAGSSPLSHEGVAGVQHPESFLAPLPGTSTESQGLLGGRRAGPKEGPAPAVDPLEGGTIWSPTFVQEAVPDAALHYLPTAAGPLASPIPSPSAVLPPSAVPDIGPLPTANSAGELPSAGPEPVILASGRNQDGPGYNLMKAVFALIQTKDAKPVSLSNVVNAHKAPELSSP